MSAPEFNREHGSESAEEVIRSAVDVYGSRTVLTTSFGIQSAVLLHAASQVWPEMPVVWIDTGYLPAETYRYAEDLRKLLGLNLHVYQSEVSPARMEALLGRLWERQEPEALDRYHALRKSEPLNRAFRDLKALAWLTGVRRTQTQHRKTLPRAVEHGELVKIHPLLDWSDEDVDRYFRQFDLPRHPLEHKGYLTVGDAHLSRPASPDDQDPRATRFGGRKQECGIHVAPTRKPESFSFGKIQVRMS